MQVEVWKGIAGFPNYAVSNLGYVRNVRTGHILKPFDNQNGYGRVDLGRNQRYFVHRLVAEAFCENPGGKKLVNHINRNKHDCRAINLEWVTHSENTQHWQNDERDKSTVENDEDALPW